MLPFYHGIDKTSIRVCNILGVDIAAVTMCELVDFTLKNINKLSGDYITVANVHTTVTAHDNIDYRKIQNGGIMAIPDGGPLSSIGRKRGYVMERTTGPAYMEQILKISEKHGWTHFFYGSTESTLEKLSVVLKRKYPNLEIAGMYSPPFRQLTKEEDESIIAEINKYKPDFVWVGLGAPKQEYWMAAHQGKVTGLMVGVGAAFDYFAGNIKRAPQWMQKNNLEWLYRWLQEPKRLFRRYFITNSKFIWYMVKDKDA